MTGTIIQFVHRVAFPANGNLHNPTKTYHYQCTSGTFSKLSEAKAAMKEDYGCSKFEIVKQEKPCPYHSLPVPH